VLVENPQPASTPFDSPKTKHEIVQRQHRGGHMCVRADLERSVPSATETQDRPGLTCDEEARKTA
jgi:hypothetical protein